MASSPDPTPSPSGPVVDMVQSVDALGSNAGRLFGRLYQGLRRKKQEPPAQNLQQQQANDAQILNITRLTGILAVISEGVIMQDNDGKMVMINQAARDLLGSVRAFWESDLGKMFAAARGRRALDGEITLGEPQRVEVNDRVIGAQMAIVADPQGNRLGTVLMLRDVTRDALADRLKDQFVTQMSHELRTPLTAIKGMSDVLLALPEDRPPNRKFLEAISRNVAVLDRMIIELLDISEIGAGSFAVRQQPVTLESLVFTVLRGFDARLKKADLRVGVMVSNREHLRIVGDDRRLQWALGHLVDNALKYTEPGGEILIRLGRVRDGYLLLEVNDTGVGINPRDLPHIFERFYRGEAVTPSGRLIDPRGLGQGLFVARAVAEAHGGYLSVASIVGEGSTFTLALPLSGMPEIEPPAMPAAPLPDETIE
ncbi:sensor histidine kinase [Aggregatilinea lenta]|uniref:sensor histidine kinase n=1 Tax=Aggregatilinea lenta TaxID=913108 RepID=UPI000E5C47E5|nr:ATP-binding protein [Aggregatilinea lenta]